MAAPALRDIQRLFWHSLATSGGDHQDGLLDWVGTANRIDRRTRLRIYKRAYFCRLRDALARDFPRLRAILGDRRFDTLARGHIAEFPSTDPSLREFGRTLPDFANGRIRKGLVDLARLEWAMGEVFDESDSTPLAMARLVRESVQRWQRIRFKSIAAIRVVHASTPVHKLWRGTSIPDGLSHSPTTIRVWRGADDRVYHAPMDAAESRAFDLMCAGATFRSICGTFSDMPAADAARDASSMLARWIADGLIADFSVDGARPVGRAKRSAVPTQVSKRR